MRNNCQMKRLISLILALFMVVGLMPVNANAAESSDPIIVIAGSDFQNSSGHSKTASLTASILSQIYTDYSYADGFLFAGDYDYNYNDSANGKAKLQETVLSAYPELSSDAMVWVQGNHDSDSLVGSTLSSSGAHDAEGYGVYVINEKDYMWYNDDEATIRNTAAKLETYLNEKRNEQYSSPIFVVSHLPLHYSMRTLKGGGDGKHANYIFDVLNEAGEAGLNIIFLFGHNHSHGWDDYLGGASIYLEKGDKINIAQNSTTVYQEETLAFTYMNAGYVGYYGNTGNGSDQTLTMTTFEISGSEITIRRYDANGYHTLKATGVYGGEYPDNKYASPVYAADTSTVDTPHRMLLCTEIIPAGEDTEEPGTETEGRTYSRITSASELVSGGKYLIFYSGSYFMLPEVVEKSNGSSYRKGFDLESTSICGNDTITGDYQAQEWTLTSSGSGWLLGNGSQYAKLTSTSDMSITATFEASGDVFTIGGNENAFTFSTGSYVLNYNSRGLINGYASNPASFWIYQMTDEGSAEQGGKPTGTVRQIMSYSELKENVGYLIVADEGEDITLTNQTNGSGLLLSGTVSADNENLWYLDLTNEYIRYGSPTGSDNFLKVTNGGASVGNSSNRVTEILDNGDGTFSLYRSSYYMNRYGGSASTTAAGYNQNNSGSRWKIYEVIAAHTYESVTVDATCAEEGTITYTCTTCGDSYTETIPATGNHVTETTTVEAGCEIEGSVTTKCTVCGEEAVDVIPALGHSYEAVVTEPTCTEGGYTTYTCACGDSYIADEVAALGHTYETTTVEPSCTENGSVTYTCHCGDTYTEVINALGHSYEAVVTAPTCTADGYTTYTCECGDTYIADYVDALGHTYESVTAEPTCTGEGTITYTCECGDSYTEIIPAVGHDYEAVVTAPTCTEGGYTTYTCDCGDSYVTDEVAALGHDYESVTVAPTCTEGGYTGNTCTICGDTTVTDETDALGHSHEAVATAPTCTAAGYTTYTCHCGDTYVADEIAALGHVNESVITEPTCETEGYTTHTCTVCGEVTVDSVVAALGHDHEVVTVAATCTEAGSVTTTCVRCGESNVEVIPALGHSHEAVITAPTCTEVGYTTYTCACGDSYVADETAALGHSYESVTVAATCTEDGSVTYTCACGDSYTEVIPAVGHTYKAMVTAPTCTEIGYTTYTCACGDSYIADEIAALGHDYEAVVTAPTCENAGYTTYTCACGDSFIADEVEALGHNYEAVVTAPTCETVGYTTYTCTCGDSYVADQTAALGHSYTYADADGYRVYTCTGCSHSYSEKLVSSYDQVSAFVSGERFVITVKSGSKYYALSHQNNSISAVQVTVSGGKITSEITEDLLWSYEGSKLSYVSGGTTYYLYTYSSGWWWWWSTPTLGISTSESGQIALSSGKLKIGNYYLRYSSSKFSANSSGTTIYLFQEN